MGLQRREKLLESGKERERERKREREREVSKKVKERK